jgi:broad specificity phosphatase PhoE
MPRLEPVTIATFPASWRSTDGEYRSGPGTAAPGYRAVVHTSLLLARHGETDWNAAGRWQGHADPPLNATGRLQASELAERLHTAGIEVIVASDLARAAETAAIVAARLRLPVTHDPDLREIDVGSWSGLTRAQVAERFPAGFARWEAGEIGHDGETREQLAARIEHALLRLAHEHAGRNVLAVTHGGAIRAARRLALGEAGDGVPNCGTVALAVADGRLAAPRGARPTAGRS